LEPWELPSGHELFHNPRLMPHTCLQSVQTLLRRMARCKTGEFAAIVKQLRAQIPTLISPPILSSAPAKRAEWQRADFIKQTGFGHIHIFLFQPQGTKPLARPAEQ
jgi:threonylcarbamoyladenosine tRNA methylthiotransferase MtaB